MAGTKTMTMAVQVGRSDSPKPDKDSNSSMQKVMLWLYVYTQGRAHKQICTTGNSLRKVQGTLLELGTQGTLC